MTNKEIGELRRRMKPDRTNLTAVYGCYVASSGEVLSTFREPFGLMAEEDKEKYLAIFRRALSGTPDKNLIDLSFTTKQVADSNEHRLLMRLRETALDDEEARQKLFQTIIGAVNFEENFLILLAHERYDVPFKAKDGAKLEDGSEVFSYFVCAVCPVKPGKEHLSYIAEEKPSITVRPAGLPACRRLAFSSPPLTGGGQIFITACFTRIHPARTISP